MAARREVTYRLRAAAIMVCAVALGSAGCATAPPLDNPAIVRRADLAQVMWRAAQDLASAQPAELSRWRASRPALADVSRAHLAYTAIAGALASGTMGYGDGERFQPSRPATGAEVVAAVARLEQMARQWGRQ